MAELDEENRTMKHSEGFLTRAEDTMAEDPDNDGPSYDNLRFLIHLARQQNELLE
jgi:hypothetical protein